MTKHFYTANYFLVFAPKTDKERGTGGNVHLRLW